jgi:hypothetical protein
MSFGYVNTCGPPVSLFFVCMVLGMRLTSSRLLLAADTGNYVYRVSGVILFYASVVGVS